MRVNTVSNALVFDNYSATHSQDGGYLCELTNQLGSFSAQRTVVDLTINNNDSLVPVYKSPLEELPSPYYLPPPLRNNTLRLHCTGLILEDNNLTVAWSKDYSQLGKTNDRLSISPTVATSGYYCCNVNHLIRQVNRHCITVVVEGKCV